MKFILAALLMAASVAQAQVMLDVARTAGGNERVSPELNVTGISVFDARLSAVLADFDDPEVFMTVRVEVSRDGGKTWPEVVTATIVGGSRTKGGGLPFVGVANRDADGNITPFPSGSLVRVRMTQNKNIRTGITGEAK